ncbi:28117_t:CDS:2, partial [Racocetra persica]
ESKNNPSDSIEKILSVLNNPNDLGLIHIYLHFISIYSRDRLEQLLAYLQSNHNFDSFSAELDNTIRQNKGDLLEFYPIF